MEDFRPLADARGLSTYKEAMAWLKADFGLGHGHANLVASVLTKPRAFKSTDDDKFAKVFSGKKARWRTVYEALLPELEALGTDVGFDPTDTYVSLLRGKRKFGIFKPASAERLDIGIKLKGADPTDRFLEAGSWNAMVTHRVGITDSTPLDDEVLSWLKKAYQAAG